MYEFSREILSMQTNKMIRREAKRRLLESGRFLSLAIGFAISAFSVVITMTLYQIVAMVMLGFIPSEDAAYLVSLLALLLLFVFVAFPIIIGYISVVYSVYKKEREVYIIDIFKYFTSPKLYFSFALTSFFIVMRILLCYCLPLIVCGVLTSLLEGLALQYYVIFDIMIFAAVYLLMSLSLSKGYLALYYRIQGYGIRDAGRLSKVALRSHKGRTFAFKLGMLGLSILSLLTIATLFIYTAPLMAMAYFAYAEKMTENIIEL